MAGEEILHTALRGANERRLRKYWRSLVVLLSQLFALNNFDILRSIQSPAAISCGGGDNTTITIQLCKRDDELALVTRLSKGGGREKRQKENITSSQI